MMKPEDFEHFIITDLGTALAFQNDCRLAIELLDQTKSDPTIEYNGIKILPIGIMYGRTSQNFNEPFKPDMFDILGKTAIFADPSAKCVEVPFYPSI